MHSRLVLAVLAIFAATAGIMLTARGSAPTTSAANPVLTPAAYLPTLSRHPNLPPPLEVSAVGRLQLRPPDPSVCYWGTHYLQANDGQIVAWIRAVNPADSWDLLVGEYVRVKGIEGPSSIEPGCPATLHILVTSIEPEPGGGPTPSPTPPD